MDFSGIAPILYIKDLGVSLTSFGYYQGFSTIIFAFGSLAAGFLVAKHDQVSLLKLSLNVLIFGLVSILVLAITEVKVPELIVLGMLPYNIAAIIPSFLLYPIALNAVPGAKGKASAMMQISRLLVSSIGLEIVGYFYTGTVRSVAIFMVISIFISAVAFAMILRDQRILSFKTNT